MAENMKLKDNENISEQEEKGIAMEILGELKTQNQGLRATNNKLLSIIVVLIILLAGTNIYHIYQWSQFESVVVDSKDGGNANYIGNDGDVNNYGEGSGPQEEKSEGK